MSKKKPPQSKVTRPDVTYPSPDPEKEPRVYEYKVGDRVKVKPYIHTQGYDISNKSGTVKDIKSYILVELNVWDEREKVTKNIIFKLLRYEIEPDNWEGNQAVLWSEGDKWS